MKVLFLVLWSAVALAAEEGEVPVVQHMHAPFVQPVSLNRCKVKKDAGRTEEAVVREAAEAASPSLRDHEVLARLIFSESLATGFWEKKCAAPSARALMEAIGWTVMNRVAKEKTAEGEAKQDAVFNVVFKPGQFRTSFALHKENGFAVAYICPMRMADYLKKHEAVETVVELYRSAREAAALVISKYQKSGLPKEFTGITNYFLPHAEFGGSRRPRWAAETDPAKNKGYVNLLGVQNPCAEFYRLRSR